MNTRDRDEILISTVIKLIKRRAIPNLKNVIAKTHSADIAPWFPRLRPEEQIILFDLLIQEGRMGEVLNELNSEERDLFIEATEASILADVLHTIEVAPKYVWFPVVVSLAICINMIIAATIGTIIPMLFKRFRIDPAIATSPFVTTSIDVFGILFYFIIARIFLFYGEVYK